MNPIQKPFLLGLACFAMLTVSASAADRDDRPHILLVLADDMGYSDAGCYGSDIATPNIDRLAKEGGKFSQFYNTARCWPTRAAMLTGYYAQQVRRDQVEGIPSGGQGKRPAWAKLLPEYLRSAGYRCYHSGKWHVDGKPLNQGFDHSLEIGGDGQNNFFSPKGNTVDERPMPSQENFYVTDVATDFAIQCLEEHFTQHASQPFFQYVAYTAPHFPLHARPEDVARYRQSYQEGWDLVREKRHQRQRELGLPFELSAPIASQGPPYFFADAFRKLGAGEVERPAPWSRLTTEQQTFQASKMAIHAAMVDRMDWNIGRMLDLLDRVGARDNTLVLFLSDNGASAEVMVRGGGHDPAAPPGSEASYLCLGPGWSTVANTPFRFHKTWVHEGGISTPLVVRWPKALPPQSGWISSVGHVIDLLPTLLEAAGVNRPPATDEAPTLPGRSLIPCLKAPHVRVGNEEYWWSHEGNRALRQQDWKLVAAGKAGSWELYNLREDRSEQHDLASSHPDQVRAMAERWEELNQQFSTQAKASR